MTSEEDRYLLESLRLGSYLLKMLRFLLIAVLSSVIATTSWFSHPLPEVVENVPSGCTVTGHNVDCNGAVGEFLPSLGVSRVRNIYISECDMSSLTSDSFSAYAEVTNIQIRYAYFSFPQQNHVFKFVKKLKNLTIEYSNVTEEIAATYVLNESLERLSLRGNRIASISNRLVSHLPHLKELDVSANGATRMEENVLEHVKRLRVIDLSENDLCGGSAGVVALAREHCVVCRRQEASVDTTTGSGSCSEAEVRSCVAGLPLDRLWWRSPALRARLEGNPLCEAQAAPPETFVSQPLAYVGDRNCEVLKNNCYLHKRRQLYLMEACGMDLASSEDVLRVGGNITTGEKSIGNTDDAVSFSVDEQNATEEKIEGNEYTEGEDRNRSETEDTSCDSDGTNTLTFGMFIFIGFVFGVVFGTVVTLIIIKRHQSKENDTSRQEPMEEHRYKYSPVTTESDEDNNSESRIDDGSSPTENVNLLNNQTTRALVEERRRAAERGIITRDVRKRMVVIINKEY